MISEAIILSLITGSVSLIVCIINNHTTMNKQRAEYEKHMQEVNAMQNQAMALMEMKIDNLQKAVEKHNHVIERVYALEKSEAVFTESMKVANHRIDDLEKAMNVNA